MVYDCFPFFNELDLLEIRLAELSSVVDRFVIVESTRTFTGERKPLWFGENRGSFSEFSERIIHVVVEDMPEGNDPWARERHQRNCIARGLQSCSDSDYILISDVDEIPRSRLVRGRNDLASFVMGMNYYFLNFQREENWVGTKSLPWGLLRQFPSIQFLRDAKTQINVADGGWHFSYLGGAEKIRQKISAFSHQEFNKSEFTDSDAVARAIREGKDLFGRDLPGFEIVEMQRLPGYVIRNRNRFRGLLWSDLGDFSLSDEDCEILEAAYRSCDGVEGEIIAISPARGASACALANVGYPKELRAVESKEDAVFGRNVRSLTLGNVRVETRSLKDLLAEQGAGWRFCLIGRDSGLGAEDIRSIAGRLAIGGVICGEFAAGAGEELAAKWAVAGGGIEFDGNFWSWRKTAE
jgi:beta-1,4-mannosyl-glycoprotein beta-1,4-N-acetylglucosaminyltransferase